MNEYTGLISEEEVIGYLKWCVAMEKRCPKSLWLKELKKDLEKILNSVEDLS